jgi:hypothetical protein
VYSFIFYLLAPAVPVLLFACWVFHVLCDGCLNVCMVLVSYLYCFGGGLSGGMQGMYVLLFCVIPVYCFEYGIMYIDVCVIHV